MCLCTVYTHMYVHKYLCLLNIYYFPLNQYTTLSVPHNTLLSCTSQYTTLMYLTIHHSHVPHNTPLSLFFVFPRPESLPSSNSPHGVHRHHLRRLTPPSPRILKEEIFTLMGFPFFAFLGSEVIDEFTRFLTMSLSSLSVAFNEPF